MSFTLTIRNIPDKELGPILARLNLPKAASYDVAHVADHVGLIEGPGPRSGPRANGATKLHMTGKQVKNSEVLNAALVMFEKLEAKEGIGTVSVDMFRADLVKRHQAKNMCTRLIHEGYLEYLR